MDRPTTTTSINNNRQHHQLNGSEPSTTRLKKNRTTTEVSQKYGWSPACTPPFLQWLANKHAFLIIFSLTCILQGTFRTYFVAVLTTVEKLFELPSQTTGLLLSATEIGQVSSALILPYYAGQGHRPRWMGIGSGIFSLAVLFCASPHWILPPTTITTDQLINNDNGSELLCLTDDIDSCSTTTKSKSTDSNYYIFIIFFLSLLTVGLGQTSVNLLGIPYLDDNVKNKESPMYFSITIGVRILGPVAGFVLGALCTRIYVYPLEEWPVGTGDSRWLGAWWLGMLIIGSLLFLTSVLLFAFPAQLPRKSTQTTIQSSPQQQQQPKIKHFPRTLRRLLSNRILCLRTLSSVFHLLPIAGLYTFLPKYLESQYNLPAHEANLYTGISGILVMGIGIFASGFVIRVYGQGIGGRGVALWICLAAFVYALGMSGLVFVGGCDEIGFGSTVNQVVDLSLPTCITNTTCPRCPTTYTPICSITTQEQYFSPCHAGCTTLTNSTYTNCQCIENIDQSATTCPSSNCSLAIYLTIFMIIVLIHSTSEVGSMLLTLRCVDKKDKALALGLVQFAIGLLGNVPCAFVYGLLIDSTCVLWGGGGCDGGKGHCLVYDRVEFRRYFHGLTAALMGIAFIIDAVIYFYAGEIKLDEVEERRSVVPAAIEMEPLNRKAVVTENA